MTHLKVTPFSNHKANQESAIKASTDLLNKSVRIAPKKIINAYYKKVRNKLVSCKKYITNLKKNNTVPEGSINFKSDSITTQPLTWSKDNVENIQKLKGSKQSPQEQSKTAVKLVYQIFKDNPELLKESVFRKSSQNCSDRKYIKFLTNNLQKTLQTNPSKQGGNISELCAIIKHFVGKSFSEQEYDTIAGIIAKKENLTKEELKSLPEPAQQLVEVMYTAYSYNSSLTLDALSELVATPELNKKKSIIINPKTESLKLVQHQWNVRIKIARCASFLQKAFDILDAEKTVRELNNVNTDQPFSAIPLNDLIY